MKNGAKFWFVFPTGHYHASTAPSHVYGKLSSVIFKTAGDDARVIIQGPKQLHMSTPEKKKDDLQAEEFSIEKILKGLVLVQFISLEKGNLMICFDDNKFGWYSRKNV